jgi:Ca2+-binding RTX toxin-like protein
MSLTQWLRKKAGKHVGSRHQTGFIGLESLEKRELLSATVAGDKLIITGTGGGDQIVVSAGLNNGELTVVSAPGVADNTVFTGIDRLIIRGRAGADDIQLTGDPKATGGGAMRIAILAGSGDDTIVGSDADDKIRAGLGNDNVSGGAGDDDIRGDAGDDTINGGEGDDTIRGDLGDDIINGDAGNDDIRGDVGDDRITGGADNDKIRGDAGNDELYGNAGNDNIRGGQGIDSIDGGTGDDNLRGGAGDDDISGGGGTDDILDVEAAPAAPPTGQTVVVNEAENNNRNNRANRIHLFAGNPVELRGTSTSSRDKDFFVFTAQASGSVAVNVQSLTGLASLEVEDVLSNDIFETEPKDGVNSGSFNVVAGRTYFVRLRSVDNRAAKYRATLTV